MIDKVNDAVNKAKLADVDPKNPGAQLDDIANKAKEAEKNCLKMKDKTEE